MRLFLAPFPTSDFVGLQIIHSYMADVVYKNPWQGAYDHSREVKKFWVLME